jgi:HIV Tat-specific factor 1
LFCRYIEGIPIDATVEEVAAHFSKCGVIAIDPRTLEPRVKLYRDPTSNMNKGDASVCYANADSVPLAIQVLDGGRLRTNAVISVKKAEFNLKGESFDASKRAKVKLVV